jgi:hypothetical protein
MEGKRPSAKKRSFSNRVIVQITAIKQHKSVRKSQDEYTREIHRQNRKGVSSKDIQLKPIETKQGVSRKTHKLNRYIVAWTAYKNGDSIQEAQKEYTRKIQREYRVRKLNEKRKSGH